MKPKEWIWCRPTGQAQWHAFGPWKRTAGNDVARCGLSVRNKIEGSFAMYEVDCPDPCKECVIGIGTDLLTGD